MTHLTARMWFAGALVSLPAIAVADSPACPSSITDAAIKAIPAAKITKCRQGTNHFVVHLEKKDGVKVELQLSAKGEVQVTEEVVPLTTIPAAVSKAFAARYPKITATKAERITKADKSVTFEIVAEVTKDNKTEATFKDDGTFLEDEAVVSPSSLPPAVTKAFAARYPKAKATRVERQTKSDKTVTFEIAFETGNGRKEATFKADGVFVEEE